MKSVYWQVKKKDYKWKETEVQTEYMRNDGMD